MLGGKSNAKTTPTIQGLMLQAGVYGKTIPPMFGCNRFTYFVIWMANLREHCSGKKKKKCSKMEKKGVPPGYAANVDLLLGQNPIAGVLQAWNNKDKYKLTYKISEQTWDSFDTTYSTGDAAFYAVVAVTLVLPLGRDFAHGSGDSVSYDDYGGEPVTYTGSREVPLWNIAYEGPDPTNPHVARYYPFTYYWKPGSGDSVLFYQNGLPDLTGGATKVRIYYAAKVGSETPLGKLNCGFEYQLGEGSEFSDAGKPEQQVIYPHYAGLGSSEFDLGIAQMMPNLRFEILGSYPMYPNLGWDGISEKPPSGDADFADMVEAIFRMGQTQAGFSALNPFSPVHHGLGCSEYPGTIQKKYMGGLQGFQCRALTYDLPNQPGNILIATASCGALSPAISDTDGNAYTTLFDDETAVVAYAQSAGAGALNTVSNAIAGSPSGNNWDLAIYEIGGVDTVLGTATESGVSGFLEPRKSHSVSITVDGEPGRPVYLFAFARVSPGSGFDPLPVGPWKDLVPVQYNAQTQGMAGGGLAWCLSAYRIVYQPGTYTFTCALGGNSAPWKLAIIAMQGSEPAQYAKPLGEIIDQETMNLTRRQCRVFGLRGSMVMESQRKALDWIEPLYVAMNADPVWSGFKLKSIPRSEVSYAGDVTGDPYTAQGWVTRDGYVAPTAAGPVADLGPDDFLGDAKEPLIIVERSAQVDRPNILQYEHIERSNDYNKVTTAQPEMGPIAQHGLRKDAPKSMPMIMQVRVARMILGIEARRINYLQNTYKFKLRARRKMLEARDLVTLTEPKLGMDRMPVILTSVRENSQYGLECTAVKFIYGLHCPEQGMVEELPEPFVTDRTEVPALVNEPVIFEPPPVMSGQNNRNEVWLVVSDSDPVYGGCAVLVSTDGGVDYNPLGTILGNGVTGFSEPSSDSPPSSGDWPAHADPDSVNDLSVDLSESLGTLASYSVADEDNFVYPCYIDNPRPTFVQSIQKSQATPLTQAVTGEIFAGDALLVFVHSDQLADDPSGISVSDSDGNTYVLLQSQPKSGGATTGVSQVWAAYNVAAAAAGANTVTVVSANGGLLKVAILEYENVASASALDQESSDSGELNITLPTGDILTTQHNELLLSYAHASSMTMNGGAAWQQVVTPGVGNFHIFEQNRPVGTYSNSFSFTGFQFEFEVGIISLKSSSPYGMPYELMAYAVAELDSLYNYTLKAIGGTNKLRRAVFGAPTQGQGVDHPVGSRFAFLSGNGILKVQLDPKWIGQRLYFKFVAFNIYGGGLQDADDVDVYTYTPTGLSGSVNPIGLPPGIVTVN